MTHQSSQNMQDHARTACARRRGFTLVEMLVVIAIVILLLSVLIVGLNRAMVSSQRANTMSLMQAIKQGLVQFHKDTGYYPPILDDSRNLVPPPALNDAPNFLDCNNYQKWYSATTLAEYLVGYGDRLQDGYGDADPTINEIPFTGIRSPGHDGVWGATLLSGSTGLLLERRPVPPEDGGPSQVFGPYLELDDDNLIASVVPGSADFLGRVQLAFPGEPGYSPTAPKVITDYWGNVIEYFRRPYPAGAITQNYRTGIDYTGNGNADEADLPTLSNVMRLRPFEMKASDAVPLQRTYWDGVISNYDPFTTARLETAEFGLFSAGPDRKAYWFSPQDGAVNDLGPWNHPEGEEWNRDNLVEIGP